MPLSSEGNPVMASFGVAVTGGRNYDNVEFVYKSLEEIRSRYGPFTLLVGDATGLDSIARDWAFIHNVGMNVFKADWKKFGRAAGPIRNKKMINRAGLLLAFPGGRGTADCVRAAQHSGIPIRRFVEP